MNDQPEIDWFRDPSTGRVTETSRDGGGGSSGEDDDEEEDNGTVNVNQEMESLPPDKPIVQKQYTAPHYPIMYSCEHMMMIESVDMGGEGGSESVTVTNSAPSIFHEITVPITVEMSIQSPDAIHDIHKTIQALQWSILNTLGHRIGIIETCNVDSGPGSERRLGRLERRPRLTRSLQVSKLPYSTIVYKIGSNPRTNLIGKFHSCTFVAKNAVAVSSD
jgi:hypothetical protein